jgi:hypothetical protein
VPRSTDADAPGDRALASRAPSSGRTRLALVIGVLAVAALALLAVTARPWLRRSGSSPAAAGSAEKIAILPLGDSITEKLGKVSYRYWLRHGLYAPGWTGIEYRGSVKDPWAHDFDPDHRGTARGPRTSCCTGVATARPRAMRKRGAPRSRRTWC